MNKISAILLHHLSYIISHQKYTASAMHNSIYIVKYLTCFYYEKFVQFVSCSAVVDHPVYFHCFVSAQHTMGGLRCGAFLFKSRPSKFKRFPAANKL